MQNQRQQQVNHASYITQGKSRKLHHASYINHAITHSKRSAAAAEPSDKAGGRLNLLCFGADLHDGRDGLSDDGDQSTGAVAHRSASRNLSEGLLS